MFAADVGEIALPRLPIRATIKGSRFPVTEAPAAAPHTANYTANAAPVLLPPPTPVFLPTVRLGTFAGPLDLLLHLVRQGRMDIFDLPIEPLCRAYLDYLNAMEAMDLSVAGEFIVMAATLLEIKSRLLLPAPPKPEPPETTAPEDPRAALVRQLLDYSRFQALAETLRDAEAEQRRLYFRQRIELTAAHRPALRFGEVSADALLRALERMLADVGAGERQITSVRRQKITLRMKMREVLTAAQRAGAGGVLLETLLPAPPFALLDIVLLFLALLELLKTGGVRAEQDSFCGAVRITAVAENAENAEEVLHA